MKRMKSLTVLIILFLCLLVSAALSFGSPEEPSVKTPIEVTDQMGRVLRLEQAPQRIVSLAPGNTELLFALGLEERIVGVTRYCNFPSQAVEKAKVGGFSTPDLEKILALSPDLVVAVGIHAKQVIPELERRGLKVLALNPGTVQEVLQAVELAGEVTGTEDEARRLVEMMEARIGLVSSLVRDLVERDRPGVFFILWHDPLMTVGCDTLQGELISLAGGRNIFAELSGYPRVDLESVVARQPAVIVANTGHGAGGNAPLEWAGSEPRLKGTSALKQGRVWEIDADTAGRPGPRIVDALEEMLRLIHPELSAKLKQ